MLIWGAVWGALIGVLTEGFAGMTLGALLGLLAGGTLQKTVRRQIRNEIAAAQRQAALEAAGTKPDSPARVAPTLRPADSASRPMASTPWGREADGQPPRTPADLKAPIPTRGAESPGAFSPAIPAAADDLPLVEREAQTLAATLAEVEALAAAAKAASPPRHSAPPLLPPAPPGALDQAAAAVRNWFVQGNTIVQAGLVILFIGLAFLVHYAAQSGLFPVELRLTAIGAVGVMLLVMGFRRREVKPAFGLSLQGGGVAVLYLTVFAAFRFYQLLPPLAAFAVMLLVCAFSCALALLQNSRTLAFAAFAGGFATPLLLSTGGGNHVALFSYYTLLNLAILFIATRRAWRELNLLGFIATFGVAGIWGWTRYSVEHYASSQPFLIAFIAIFIATAILYARATPLRLGRSISQAVDSTLVFGTPLLGFGLQAGLVQPFEYGAAFSALVFGAVYLVLAALLLRRSSNYRLLAECFLALGVGFATLAVPLALDANWTSAVWALEGAAAFWVGMRQARWMPRAFGLLLQVLAVLSYFGALALPTDPEIWLVVLRHLDVRATPVSPWPLAHPAFLGALLIALPAVALARWTRAPLPHSGSRWAQGYAALEARLPTLLLLYGFAMWLLAWWMEFERRLPPVEAGQWSVPVWDKFVALWLMTGMTLLSSAALFLWGQRARWPAASWPSRLILPVLALVLLTQWGNGWRVSDWPAALGWPLALGLHAWLLRRNEADDGLLNAAWRRWLGWQHTGTVWLAVLLIGDVLSDWAWRNDLWDTDWASVVGVLAATAVLLALTFWAGRANRAETRAHFAWPLNPHAEAYYWRAAAPLALLLVFGAFALALTSSGDTEPLPYIPLLNPTDLMLLLAIGALLLWRGAMLAAEPRPTGAEPLNQPVFWVVIGLLALVALSTVWLRVAHHFFAVPWRAHALFDSFVVQTGYAILWSLIALALMVAAHRRALRPAWLAGAALLALVVAKLILVDLSNRGGGERIVAFIGVGVLMLVVGYFAPLPPKQATEREL
ncbi:MAG: DUF2339 domain-containing protein [Betaproteobacteria bacterium]|nr:DUF2339 domain-containing protein [Betaproteobacteria bacterium]MCL2887307.1 DUF2339 domain-containing protein [Betaproteobacteria bacterium]